MITYSPIGVIHSPYVEPSGTPVQALAARDVEAVVEIYPEYAEGLKDIDGFSHLILLYHLHRIKPCGLLVKPFLGDEIHGIFATRSPGRPNPIGFSVVRLLKIIDNRLTVCDVDILDQTPLLDVKPYVAEIDVRPKTNNGWVTHNLHKLPSVKDDGRFV